MAELQKFFPPTTPQAIASYNFTDIAEGTGIVKVYGSKSSDTSATTYSLSQNPLYSSSILLTSTSKTDGTTIDEDFDIQFNTPKIIDGKLKINLPYGIKTETGNGGMNFIVRVKARKWDGSTETELASIIMPTHGGIGASTTIYLLINVEMDIPRTHFKSGDIFRITLEFVVGVGFSGAVSYGFGIDPKNREGSGSGFGSGDVTEFTAYIPFILIDL